MNKIRIFTDGGCRGNHQDNNIGGWGALLSLASIKKKFTVV